jgi:hypothetical protein
MLKKSSRVFFLVGITSLLFGCATYYQKNLVFQEQFSSGNIEAASKTLDKNNKAVKDKNRLLYFLQKGVVSQMLGEYETSNNYFEQAYFFTEDYRKNYFLEAASLVTNPMLKTYTGEDHELVLMHYFKTLNFLRLNQYDAALVECRRINNKLNVFNDKYAKRKNRYKQDAFALNLMGITYEASGDINNAFIAYRNAYEAYEEDYAIHFNTPVPEQLKKDLLRSAYLNGFTTELREFEKKFNTTYTHQKPEGGELLFFWHNGLGPIKDEWSINFAIVKGQNGVVLFENKEYGLSFPFPVASTQNSTGGLGDLKLVRAAFPKYIERKPFYNSGELSTNGITYPLEFSENINAIAFSTLEDRMLREMGTALLRLALKQAAEERTRKENEGLGALMSIVNAATEKADTRNWQTLPHSISYARIPLKEGQNTMDFKLFAPYNKSGKTNSLQFNAKQGETVFYIFHSLESN